MSPSPAQIDPRGPRFTASVTLVLFTVVLLVAPSTLANVLLGVQAVFFAIGAFRGVQFTPTAYVFKNVVRPRLAAPDHLEDPQPPRFAQAVGLGFTILALTGYLSGATLLGAIATGFALVAATLNAVFGFCLGCELYLLARRLAPAKAGSAA
ncbi:DUF4395 domain-containing protein [Marmoricola sp. RAF53]|uniref:DUF4395 domain-containing protein n=1 Tax=Marmoricola sp. RAF53 TaxID=3233059 RepID=UPI003F96370E